MGLLKTALRWSGALLLTVATFWAAHIAVPDVLVAGDGRTFAVRGADGRLAFHHTGPLPPANGLRPMPTAATSSIAAWGRASPAMRPAASAGSLTARLLPM